MHDKVPQRRMGFVSANQLTFDWIFEMYGGSGAELAASTRCRRVTRR